MRRRAMLLALSTLTWGCRTSADGRSALREGESTPPASTPQAAIDAARSVLLITGKGTGSPDAKNLCAGDCHGVDADKVKSWGDKQAALSKCWDDAEKATPDSDPDAPKTRAQAQLACMKTSPTATTWATGKLGFARAGVFLPFFQDMFKAALGDAWQAEYDKFAAKMLMPPKGEADAPRMEPEDFYRIWSWVGGASPDYVGLKEALDFPVTPTVPCVEQISDAMQQHVATMKDEGWAAKNAAAGLPMFGCESGKCFEQVGPDHKPVYLEAEQTSFGKGWVPAGASHKIRHLRTLAGASSYWMRSSADGRFVANGGAVTMGDEGGSTVEDLLLKDRPRITIYASYDPGFFPDNKGFTYHGVTSPPGAPEPTAETATFCSQRLLENPATKVVKPNQDTQSCGTSTLSVYQAVGASLDGSGYYVMRTDNYTNDNGAYDAKKDPSVISFATPSAVAELWAMTPASDTFKVAETPIKVAVPFEGDWSIAPSATIAASRIASGAFQQGYRVRKIEGTPPALKLTELATVCMPGGKATFSYDERFMTSHHYVAAGDFAELGFPSATDPAFAKLVGESSNVFVYDFKTKTRTRVTSMRPGQFALYPHFRSDGWMYFLVRDLNDAKDYVMATDVARRLAQ